MNKLDLLSNLVQEDFKKMSPVEIVKELGVKNPRDYEMYVYNIGKNFRVFYVKDDDGEIQVQLEHSFNDGGAEGWIKVVKDMKVAKSEAERLAKELEKIDRAKYDSEDDKQDDILNVVKKYKLK